MVERTLFGPGGATEAKQDTTLAAINRFHHVLDSGNSRNIVAADAQPGNPWVGAWVATRSNYYIRQLIVLNGSITGIGGTFTFQYSEDGVTATITESRVIADFVTVRDFDLINAGAFFRVKFEPTAPLGANIVYLTTTQRRTSDGQFVRLATQEIEEANAALPQTFAYIKAFDEATGKSTNVRATANGGLRVTPRGLNPDGTYVDGHFAGTYTLSPATSVLGVSAVYTSNAIDTEHFPTIRFLVASDVASAASGVKFEWSDTQAFTTVRSTERRTFQTGNTSNGLFISLTTRARYLRITYTNGTVAQTRFFLNLRLQPIPIVASVDINPVITGNTGQQDVGLTALQVASSPLAGRKSLRLKNLTSSARPLFYGFSGSVSTASGDELAAGESVEFDADEFVTVYVLTTSTGGAGVRIAWAEIA